MITLACGYTAVVDWVAKLVIRFSCENYLRCSVILTRIFFKEVFFILIRCKDEHIDIYSYNFIWRLDGVPEEGPSLHSCAAVNDCSDMRQETTAAH